MATDFGRQTASGHLHVSAESKEPYAADVEARFREDAAAVMDRYPQARSALLPLLHLVQSVDGYVSGRGIELCAELLDLETAEVSGVATFYTQYKRHPNGEYTVGVCTNTLCAIMGGDRIWDEVSEYLGVGHDETTADGKITLERIECNAACDYAPVVMTNWEFFDNQTPESTKRLVDDLRDGTPVTPSRGPGRVCTFKEVSRVLAGFSDGLADEGVGAGPASLVGLELAHQRGWVAPDEEQQDDKRGEPQDRQQDQHGAPESTAAETTKDAGDEPVGHPAGDEEAPHTSEADKGGKSTKTGGDESPEAPDVLPAHDVDEPALEQAGVAAVEPPIVQAMPKSPTGRPVPVPEPEPVLEPAQPGASGNAMDPEGGDDDATGPESGEPATRAASAHASTEPAVLPGFAEPSTERDSGPRHAPPGPATPTESAGDPAAAPQDATVPRGRVQQGTDSPAVHEAPAPTQPAPGGEDGPHGPGSAYPGPDGKGPQGWEVKGKTESRIFHTPDSPWYRRTRAEVWFVDVESAVAAGFTDALEPTPTDDPTDEKGQ